MSGIQQSSDLSKVVQQGLGAEGVAAWKCPAEAAFFRRPGEHDKLSQQMDKVSFSDAAIAALEEQLAAQSKTQNTSGPTAADRYAAAQAEGHSLDEWIETRKNIHTPSTKPPELPTGNMPSYLENLDKGINFLGTNSLGVGTTSVTSKQGTVVSVEDSWDKPPYHTTITRKDGLQLSLYVSDDLRINDLEDGSLSLYFPSTGKTCIFDPSGLMRVEEGAAGQSGTANDDILINVKGSTVDGGEGDDTVFNFVNNATINGGNGDDTVFVNESSGNTINMGDGNDRLVGRTLSNSHVDMGEGDNVVSIGNIEGGTLRAGDGNNELIANSITGDTQGTENTKNTISASFGNGNNTVLLGSLNQGAQMNLGDGNNSIKIQALYAASSLNVGDGNNTLSARNINDGSSLNAGDGNNTVFVNGVSSQSTVILGDGKNTYMGNGVLGDSHVTLGNGGNTIWLSGALAGGSSVNSGSGDDVIHVSYLIRDGSIYAGDGNDIIRTESASGSIYGGNGDDSIITGNKTIVKNKEHLTDALQSLRNAQLAYKRYAAQM